MTIRTLGAVLTLGLLMCAVRPTALESQICGPINGGLENDLCWMNRFASANYGVSSAQLAAYRVYTHGPNSHTVSLERAPWGGNYFSWADGGIATRWQAQVGEPEHAPRTPQTWGSVQRMDSATIARLSPSEKLDILVGNRDFRITQHELSYRGPFATGIQRWEGFCNGIRAAGALTPEPQHAVRRVTPEGMVVVFEPTDIKALLGAAYFYVGENNNYAQIGDNNTLDPNAGAFDIALRMLLGGSDQVFFMDENTGSQIWNHTIVAYERKLIGQPQPLPDGMHKVEFETTVHHMGETSIVDMSGHTAARIANLSSCCVRSDTYAYELTVDSHGRIVEARWKNGLRPDFVWFASGAGDDSNHTPESPGGRALGYRGNPNVPFVTLMDLVEESRRPSR